MLGGWGVAGQLKQTSKDLDSAREGVSQQSQSIEEELRAELEQRDQHIALLLADREQIDRDHTKVNKVGGGVCEVGKNSWNRVPFQSAEVPLVFSCGVGILFVCGRLGRIVNLVRRRFLRRESILWSSRSTFSRNGCFGRVFLYQNEVSIGALKLNSSPSTRVYVQEKELMQERAEFIKKLHSSKEGQDARTSALQDELEQLKGMPSFSQYFFLNPCRFCGLGCGVCCT